jgi:regulator of sigma E protease
MGRFPDYIQYIPEEDVEEAAARPVIVDISESLEHATGLKRKDIITTINGEPATYGRLRELEHGSPGETLRLDVLRPAIWFGLLRREDAFNTQIEIARVGSVGVTMGTKYVHVQAPPGRIIPEALLSSKKALDLTMKTLARLVTGHLSPRDLGGPVMIAQVTVQAANMGLSWLLEMTAFISINLCVFNLLPLPVLDGGHLVFLGIEGVRRKPLSTRVMEWVQQAGLVFIIMLLLFVTFNDVQRWITNIIP